MMSIDESRTKTRNMGPGEFRDAYRRTQEIRPSLPRALDEAHQHLREGHTKVSEVIEWLGMTLTRIRDGSDPTSWNSAIKCALEHPLRELVHQDPLTYRAFSKPRGYPGDAELLDLMYTKDYKRVIAGDVPRLGKEIFDYTIDRKAPAAVRERRDLLARIIDATCDEIRSPHILSLGCGHLREAGLSKAVHSSSFGRFMGLDQDPECLETVRQELGGYGVETIQGSVRSLWTLSLVGERFDLIYAAGLYDYLGDRLARSVTTRLFGMLRAGGRLLIANYLPGVEDVGYMETYMGWRLIYRSAEDLHSLCSELPTHEVSDQVIFPDGLKAIAFLELRKRGQSTHG